MINRDAIHGGFNGSLRSQMSPTLQRRLAEEEDREAREAREEERARALRAEAFQESSIQGAIQAALAAGEAFHPRWLRGEKLGHTTAEFIAQRSAEMDAEDAQLKARQRITYNRWLEQQSELNSGDFTAPSQEEMASRAKREERQREDRMSSAVRRNERRKTVDAARKVAAGDTAKLIYATERARSGW